MTRSPSPNDRATRRPSLERGQDKHLDNFENRYTVNNHTFAEDFKEFERNTKPSTTIKVDAEIKRERELQRQGFLARAHQEEWRSSARANHLEFINELAREKRKSVKKKSTSVRDYLVSLCVKKVKYDLVEDANVAVIPCFAGAYNIKIKNIPALADADVAG